MCDNSKISINFREQLQNSFTFFISFKTTLPQICVSSCPLFLLSSVELEQNWWTFQYHLLFLYLCSISTLKMQSFNIDSSCQTIAICFPHCFYMNRFWNEWIFESTNDFSHEYFLFLLPSKNYPLVNNSSWMFVKNVSYIPLIISRALNPLRSFDFCHLSYQLRLIYSNILGQQK